MGIACVKLRIIDPVVAPGACQGCVNKACEGRFAVAHSGHAPGGRIMLVSFLKCQQHQIVHACRLGGIPSGEHQLLCAPECCLVNLVLSRERGIVARAAAIP